MGIRFYCSSCGHKLNVKAFLAGKRGVCPECGSGLDIPFESTIQKGAPKYDPAMSPGGNGDGKPSDAIADSPVPTAKPVALADAIAPAATPIADAAASVSVAEPRVTPRPAPLASARDSKVESADARGTPVRAVPTRAKKVERQAAPAEVAPVDPIIEAPNASWYVRPPSGGEYGPAPGETMRKWLNEGRVSANSLVWRVGWDDWRNAGSVFPSLGGAPAPPSPTAVPSNGFSDASADGTSPRYRARPRNSTALAITTVVVLGLMSVALLITLIVILNR